MTGWLKVLVGAVIVLVIGTIFWLGAAYQRFTGMELQLIGIRSDMSELIKGQSGIREIIDRENEQQRRIERLEDQIRQLK